MSLTPHMKKWPSHIELSTTTATIMKTPGTTLLRA